MQSAPPAPVYAEPLLQRVLRTPLLGKLILFDLVVNAGAVALMGFIPENRADELTAVSLAVVLVVNAALVAFALRPLAHLEDTARRVSAGAFDARTKMLPGTDRNLQRIGATFDALLDRVESDRIRLRALTAQVVAAADQERARLARELHDGTAQSLSALEMLLASAAADRDPKRLAERLDTMRQVVTEALAEVRSLSHAMHPRVVDELGLPSALDSLSRVVAAQTTAQLAVRCDGHVSVPAPVAAVLYRVAQEAVHNAIKHGSPARITIELTGDAGAVRLRVTDDGQGFVRDDVEAGRRGMGMFVMEERVSLVDGTLMITSRPGHGTVIEANVPIRAEEST